MFRFSVYINEKMNIKSIQYIERVKKLFKEGLPLSLSLSHAYIKLKPVPKIILL